MSNENTATTDRLEHVSSTVPKPSPAKEPPAKPRSGNFGHRLRVASGALEVVLHGLVVLIAFTEVAPRLMPEPVLLYRVTEDQIPGSTTIATVFSNPNRNWPVERFEARWRVEHEEVTLTSDGAAPPHEITNPAPLEHRFAAQSAIPALVSFSTFLHSDKSFQVFEQRFSGSVPRVLPTAVVYEPIQVLDEAIWEEHERQAYYRIAMVAILGLAFALVTNHFFRIVRRRLT